MTTPLDELDTLRQHDPAAHVDPDPHSATAHRIQMRATGRGGQSGMPPLKRVSRTPRRALVAVAVLTATTGAAAIAQVGPFATEWEACHAGPSEAGRDVPYPECADFVSERVLAEVEADGSDFERRVLADRLVTREEYDQAAQRTVGCIRDGLEEASVTGAEVAAVESSWQLGFRYGFQVSYPPDVNTDALPWAEDETAPDTRGDDDAVRPAIRITDEMMDRDPTLRCPAEHYERIDRVWEAQQIAAQGG